MANFEDMVTLAERILSGMVPFGPVFGLIDWY